MLRAALRHLANERTAFLGGIHMGVAALFGKEAGAHYKAAMRELEKITR